MSELVYVMKTYLVLLFSLLSITLFSQNSNDSLLKNQKHTIRQQEKSERQRYLEKCIQASYKKRDWERFNICIKEHRVLVRRKGDSSAYAKNLYFKGLYFNKRNIRDSSYSCYIKSLYTYRKLKDSSEIGRLLLNIAIIEKEIADYKSSENSSVEAIKYLSKSKYKNKLTSAYNNLGLVLNQLGDTLNALKYHHKALALKRERKAKPIEIIASINNIGKLYKDHKQYAKAIEYFKQGFLYDSTLNRSLKSKATLLDNFGYCRFKNGEPKIGFKFMNEALTIRVKGNYLDGIVINNIHLAEYYAEINDTLTAIRYAEDAEKISRKTKNNGDYKKVLDLLSNLHTGEKIREYHNKYKSISDSLTLVELKNKEQYARIKFETEEQEQKLQEQKKENFLIKKSILIFSLVIVVIVVVIYFHKRFKKQKLTKIFSDGFKNYLIEKYNLTPENIEFWELWVTGLDQSQLSERLFISIDAVKSRRKSLKKKIGEIQTIEGNFTQTKATHIYNLEKDIFKNFS